MRKCLRQKTVLAYLLIHKSSQSTWDYLEINSINMKNGSTKLNHKSSTILGNCD